ncbi:COG4705 family protein [Cryobacterium zhongshanensis]|uniref:Membrane-anchored protein n=1 Tax=Cryobacterium zhongshanensis TaxID=2928153 RepID=A0AA41QWZ5_9MICO|nr:hypothetical protein [Cryobacterium zhongshanensis]MCI4658123.1 hypothetical protein [Cryobacterium zhongshanensis]
MAEIEQSTRPMLSRVPEVTAAFWVAKVLTTGMGETTADYLVHQIDPPLAVGLAGLGLLAILLLQFALRRYVAGVYWLAVVMVSIFGTMAADAVHVGLGIPYLVSTVAFVLALAALFLAWRTTEKSLSIHSIVARRRECFYWATVLTTFALGTAAGDLTAMTFGLGYLASGIVFAVLIAIPAVAYLRFGMNATLAFWFAYVLTRPLGASFADWAAVSPARGGLDLGTGPVSLVLALAILALVALLASPSRESGRIVGLTH